MRKQPLRIFWIFIGFICFGLGTAGIVLPILPTVPFYMAAAFCFAKSSEKLHRWFLGTGFVSKTSGKLCETESHDHENQVFHCRNGDRCHADWISGNAKCSGRTNLYFHCMVLSCSVLFPESGNPEGGSL